MRAIPDLAIVSAIAAFALTSVGNAQEDLPLFSIKGGETLPLLDTTYITAQCKPLFLNLDSIDVLEGPSELLLQFEPRKVHTHTTAHDCPELVDGGTIMAAAKDVTEQEVTVLTFRMRLNTKQGAVQQTFRYGVLLFPASTSDEQHGDAREVRAHAEELATRASVRFDELQRHCIPLRVHLEQRAKLTSERSDEAQALALRAWRAAIAYHWCRNEGFRRSKM